MFHPLRQSEQLVELARLSLAKFSHTATSTGHRGPLHWNHLIGSGDIIGVFEKFTVSNIVSLKVLHSTDIIEHINLTELAQAATSEPQTSNPSASKPIFAVVVKLPCLAIKYPTRDGYVRRFQMKFGLDRDYYTALAILSDINCPFSEPNIGPMPPTRKPSTTQWQMGSSSSIIGSMVPNTPIDRYQSNGAFTGPHEPTAGASAATSSVTAAQASLPSSSSTMHTIPADFWISNTNHIVTRDATFAQDNTTHNQTYPVPSIPSAPIRRPSTATTCYDAKSLENILPPKRQLPFLKPAPQRAPTVLEPSSVRSSAPSSEGPKPHQDANPRPATSSGHVFRKPDQVDRPANTNARVSTAVKSTNPSPAGDLQGLSEPPNRSIALSTEPSLVPSSLPLSGERHHQPTNPTQTAPVKNAPSLMKEPGSQDPDVILTNLSSYLSSPSAERTRDLENWICQHIEDDGFVQLCQDVEGIWRRIAVGK